MVRECKRIAAWSIGVIIWMVKNIFQMQHGCCRFSPSCTEFAQEAIEKLPVITAISVICTRVMKCHPFNRGGLDPVPDKGYLGKGQKQ